ncbi:MAG: NBR1-Ig-like domain-containing protein, partial [Acidobacteriota bacterium]
LENRGSATWRDGWRLGAAAGCPDAASENAIAWAPASGYANSLTDARVDLDAPVAPGQTVEVHVPVVAPVQPGSYTFAARMVDEGTAWFGPTATASITVSGEPDPGAGSGSDSGQGGGGCAVGGGAGWLVALLALRRPR